jgi:hypothetical protein
MQTKYVEGNLIFNVSYMDSTRVNDTLVKTKSLTTEDYILNVFWVHQKNEYILLPFNFRYIFNDTIVLQYVSP